MSDIFVSYSRKDSEQALELAERLQGEGMSVWIDQRGIEAASSRSFSDDLLEVLAQEQSLRLASRSSAKECAGRCTGNELLLAGL